MEKDATRLRQCSWHNNYNCYLLNILPEISDGNTVESLYESVNMFLGTKMDKKRKRSKQFFRTRENVD